MNQPGSSAVSNFEETVSRDGRLVYSNVGDSMYPLIREGRDLIIVEAADGPLRRFDVPLYRRDNGKVVLHRIISARKGEYVLCGDNRWQVERGITDRHIIGILTAVVRDGNTISVQDKRYRLYVYIWCGLFPLRAIVFRLRDLVYGSFRKGKRHGRS